MEASSHSSPDPLSDPTPYTQDEETLEALLEEVNIPAPKLPPGNASSRRFTADAEDLSAPLLGQGFQYQTKQPNPPGQFTGRHMQVAQRHSNEPLLLPELAFSPSAKGPEQTSVHFRAPEPGKRSSPLVLQSRDPSLSPKSSSRSSRSSGNLANRGMEPELGSNEARESAPRRAGFSGACNFAVKESQTTTLPRVKATVNRDVVRSASLSGAAETAVKNHATSVVCNQNNPDRNMSSHAKESNFHLKIAPHILHHTETGRFRSPMSTCGDLEKPIRRPRSGRSSKSPRFISGRQESCDESPRPYHLEDCARSHSRASNVSKKRSTVHKAARPVRGQQRPDRKAMMQEIASQWNEYLLAADRDKEEYCIEIEGLQHELNSQALQLEQANQRLQQRDKSLDKMVEVCTELRAKHDTVSKDREHLEEQLNSLQKKLDATEEQNVAVRERNSTCRKKVNEAISEHQKLYKITKSYCADVQEQLALETKERAEQADGVRQALQKSLVQRKAMKNFASFVEKEITARETLKDETISALKSRISEQHQTISRVTFLEKSLKTQLQAQQATQRSVDELHGALAAFCRMQDRNSDAQSILSASIDEMNDKLHSFLESVGKYASDSCSKNELAACFGTMENALSLSLDRVLNIVSESKQEAKHESTSRMTTLLSTIHQLRNELKELVAHSLGSAFSSQALETNIHGRLDKLDAGMQRVHLAEQRVEGRLDFMVSEGEANASLAASRLDEVTKKLEKRDSKINELKRQLQLVTEDYDAKLEAMRKEVMVSESTADLSTLHLANQIDELGKSFEAQLDFALAQQREECEIAMREEQTDHWTAENSLRETKAKLQALSFQPGQNPGLEDELKSQKAQVSELNTRLATYERQAEMHKELSSRWRRDIEAVDEIRSRLTTLNTQIAPVEALSSGLERMLQVHDYLNSTAEYLSVEQDWVQKHLRPHAKAVSPQRKAIDNARVPGETARVACDNVSQSLGTSQNEWERRRVVVQSPSGSIASPSPPPSVEQERKRRRAGYETQSILRLSAATSESQQVQAPLQPKPEEHSQPARGLFDLMKGHSRYFRPITSTAPATMPAANIEIVEQIRAGLTQRRGLSWSLPTLSDFEGPHQGQGIPEMEDGGFRDISRGPAEKRIKLEM